MINLNETPEALLTVADGEDVVLDGQIFMVSASLDLVLGPNIYLTLMDGDSEAIKELSEDGLDFDSYYDKIHVREPKDQYALLTREAFVQIIKSKGYYIG